ncbi:hypothetical protein [Lentibacillus cibarius]|uniref:hypothetical protein n=1 Tax=Lentibacillus cibarius TaxID=2583219 RepID=UPI001486D5E7|nr:hypothetical protein [Lentibacillus cibarius]
MTRNHVSLQSIMSLQPELPLNMPPTRTVHLTIDETGKRVKRKTKGAITASSTHEAATN